jgi:hypothetical protein
MDAGHTRYTQLACGVPHPTGLRVPDPQFPTKTPAGRRSSWPLVVFVADQLITVSITCWVDGLVHEVTEEDVAAGRRCGHRQYRAICGYRFFWPAALVVLTGQPCARCAAVLATAREPDLTAGRVRRWCHRQPGWWRWVLHRSRNAGTRWWS